MIRHNKLLWLTPVLCLPLASAWAQPDLALDDEAEAVAGRTVKTDLTFENSAGSDVYGISFFVTYDPDKVTPGTIESGPALGPNSEIDANVPAPGELRVIVYPESGVFDGSGNALGPVGSGVLAKIPWTVNASVIPSSAQIKIDVPLEIETTVMSDQTAASVVPDNVTDGSIEVQICGDVNASGTVTAADVSRLRQQLAGSMGTFQNAAADVNSSGTLSAADVTRLSQYLAGLSVAFCPPN